MCAESLWLAVEKKREEGARPSTLKEINAETHPEPQTVQGDTYRPMWRPRITRTITLIFSSKLLQVEAFGEKDTHVGKEISVFSRSFGEKKIKMSSKMHGHSQCISTRNTLVIITTELKNCFSVTDEYCMVNFSQACNISSNYLSNISSRIKSDNSNTLYSSSWHFSPATTSTNKIQK